MEVDEVGAEDVADVLGEMANIIGGNVKSMLPDGCFLSLPQVVMAPETITRYPAEIRVTGLYGTWEGEPISISMWQSRNDVKKEETS
jgi:chemotaxis protein CheX